MKSFVFAVLGLFALPLMALDGPIPTVAIHKAFARATNGKNGAIFGKIENTHPDKPLVLIGATSPACDHVELHTHKMVSRGAHQPPVFRMVQIEEMSIRPNDARVLKPGGDHIMLMGLKGPLKEGDEITINLLFKGEPPLEMIVPIKAAGHKECHCHKH